MNIDHVGFTVKDFKKSRDFYVSVLACIGLPILEEGPGWAMLGKTKCDVWFGEEGQIVTPLHIAFVAETHGQVEEFYKKAMELGAKDNGKPDYCPEYSPTYFAAFIIDLNGHNLEVVCRK
jgi:catechol 2,3-dioxygenase-like lactoylglutathione lyase family enzyme